MLLIDVGNSRIKWSFWKNKQMMDYTALIYDVTNLDALLTDNLNDSAEKKVCVCSVAGSEIDKIISAWFELNWNIKIDMAKTLKQQSGVVNAYKKVETMGVDRWMAIVAAHHRYKENLCVIDCGTAVTIDLVNKSGQHLGGLIMPGLDMMRHALMAGTRQINSIQGEVSMLADNTEEAVTGGCYNLLALGLEAIYKKYSHTIGSELLCVVTGGNGENMVSALNVKCHYRRELVLEGLLIMAQGEA